MPLALARRSNSQAHDSWMQVLMQVTSQKIIVAWYTESVCGAIPVTVEAYGRRAVAIRRTSHPPV